MTHNDSVQAFASLSSRIKGEGGSFYVSYMLRLYYVQLYKKRILSHGVLRAVGVCGGSYGGYMTMWIVTQTDRFKAAVSHAGLSNHISFYVRQMKERILHTTLLMLLVDDLFV